MQRLTNRCNAKPVDALHRLELMPIIVATLISTCLADVIRGPYLSFVHNPMNSMVISWGTDTLSMGSVAFGTDTLNITVIDETIPDTMHYVELSGLLESTRYFYKVFCDSDTITGNFWTAPLFSEVYHIVAYGDSRTNPDRHGRVVARYMQYPHRLILNSGDLAYDGEIWEFDDYLFTPAAEAMLYSPYITCVGGHDADPWNTPPYYTFENYCSLMQFPGNELYFSYDYGPIHMTILNSEVAWQYGPETIQTQWLMADLTSTNQPYRIVMFHMPPYTSGSGNPSNMGIREHWCPIFRQHHVQMVINGHQHFYQRCEPGDGIVYVISGGGGAGLYEPTFDSSYVVAACQAYHFIWLQINPDSITVTAIDTANTILDHFAVFPWSPIVPEQVQNFTIQYDTTGMYLHWDPVLQDIQGNPLMVDEYRIYRHPGSPNFVPDFSTFIASTTDTFWVDTTASLSTDNAFYKLTAAMASD